VKIRADEHISPHIVAAINQMALSAGFEFSSVIDSGHRGSTDVHWVTAFGSEGGKAILTADTDFFSRPHQVMAVHDAGLMIIHMPPKWANAPCHLQAAHILAWWRRIEVVVKGGRPKQCWRPDWNVTESGELKNVKIDYEEHRKKLQKANRPSRQGVHSNGP
jgi:PIN like domain